MKFVDGGKDEGWLRLCADVFSVVKNGRKHMLVKGNGSLDIENFDQVGSLTPPAMTDQFCELIKASLGIAKDRIYIGFDDVNASDWGWNGSTFG